MHPDLKASLTADKVLDRTRMTPEIGRAYDTLVSEVGNVRGELSPQDYARFLDYFDKDSQSDLPDLAIGYVSSRFDKLDRNQNGQIELEELDKRKKLLLEGAKEGDLPKSIETSLLDNLIDRHNIIKHESKDDSVWSLFQEPNAITRADLSIVLSRGNRFRKEYAPKQFLSDSYLDPGPGDMPESVRELVGVDDIRFKSVAPSLSDKLKSFHDRYPNTHMAAGLYSPETNEIMTEKGSFESQAREHELGHFIDDTINPGRAYFSESPEFVKTVEQDMKGLSTSVDWNTELRRGHPFVRSGLYSGTMSDSGRKEMFADFYQSKDMVLACKMIQLFPKTSRLVDDTLNKYGIERFGSGTRDLVCDKVPSS